MQSVASGPSAVTGGTINVYWHVINNGTSLSQGNIPDSQITASITAKLDDDTGHGIDNGGSTVHVSCIAVLTAADGNITLANATGIASGSSSGSIALPSSTLSIGSSFLSGWSLAQGGDHHVKTFQTTAGFKQNGSVGLARTNGRLTELQRQAAMGVDELVLRPCAGDPTLADRFMSLGYIGFSPTASSSALADPKDKIELYTMTMKALELSERDDKPAALAALDRALARDPDIAQVHFVRGSILGDLGRYAEAAAALERTVALNPRYVTARFKLALAYLRLNKHADAERALESVLRALLDARVNRGEGA